MAYFIVKVYLLLFQNDQIQIPTLPLPAYLRSNCGKKTSEDCDLTPFYYITAENISKSRKSNSTKNPTYKNFGHLNQSRYTKSGRMYICIIG